jgi:hypothetical protein
MRNGPGREQENLLPPEAGWYARPPWDRTKRKTASNLSARRGSRRLRLLSRKNGQNGKNPNPSPSPSQNLSPKTPETGTAIYGEFIAEQLNSQEARKASFEQRGVAVITTAGVLVTLLFGLASLSTTGKTFSLSGQAKEWLAIALVIFVVAAALAVATNVPLPYRSPKAEALKRRVKAEPVRDEDAAIRDIALTRANMLKTAKTMNAIKGWLLIVAMACEVVAIGFVAAAIYEVIHP